MNDDSKNTLLGNFDLHDAKVVCDLIEKHQIEFEIEIDDSPIRNMSPFQASIGGTFGSGASANIFVPTDLMEKCVSILEETNK